MGVLAIGHAGLKKMQDKEKVTGFFDFTSNNKGRSANASGTAAVAALLQPVKEERDRSPSLTSFEDDEESNRTKFDSPLPDEVNQRPLTATHRPVTAAHRPVPPMMRNRFPLQVNLKSRQGSVAVATAA